MGSARRDSPYRCGDSFASDGEPPQCSPGTCPLRVKLRNTRNEQIFSALPPITDILGGRLARLSSDGRECFHSQYSANPLGERPARALQTDKVLRSLLAGWKLDSFVLN